MYYTVLTAKSWMA